MRYKDEAPHRQGISQTELEGQRQSGRSAEQRPLGFHCLVDAVRHGAVTGRAANWRSVRKPRFAKAFGKERKMLRPAEWGQISQIGDAQIGIAFACACDAFPCSLEASGERIAGREHADCQQEIRIVAQRFFGR